MDCAHFFFSRPQTSLNSLTQSCKLKESSPADPLTTSRDLGIGINKKIDKASKRNLISIKKKLTSIKKKFECFSLTGLQICF